MRHAGLAIVVVMLLGGVARAQTPPPAPPSPAAAPETAPPPPPPSPSGFDVEFGGGALIPTGDLALESQAGLDVGGRFGWSSSVGLGLVLSLDYAPLRQKTHAADETSDAHLFYGSLAPRFAFGRSFVRVWLSAGAGVIVERTQTQSVVGGSTSTTTDSGLTLGGQGGLDFLFFDSGGLSVSGGYTKGLAAIDKYQYLAFTAGLLFML
jgi:hypothetical protein